MNSLADQLLFQKIDSRHFALFRIVLGALVFCTIARLFGSIDTQISDAGWLSRSAAAIANPGDPWLLAGAGGSRLMTLLELGCLLLASVSFTFGFQTKSCNILLLAGLAALRARNVLITYGGDDLIRIFLFCLIFAPGGARWSIDGWRLATPRPLSSAVWPLRMIQFQICLIYFIAGSTKFLGTDWANGQALAILFQDSTVNRFDLRLLLSRSLFSRELLAYATRSVPWGEIAFPLLVWLKRTRPFIIGYAIVMHLGIAIVFKAELFSYLMLTGYLSFAPTRWLDILERGLGGFAKSLALNKRVRN